MSEPKRTVVHVHEAATRASGYIEGTRCTVETCECDAQRSVYTVPAHLARAMFGNGCQYAATFSEWVKLSAVRWVSA